MDKNEILFAKLADDVIIPSKRDEDGCYDVYAHFDEEYRAIQPHEVKLIPTGIRSHFSPNLRISIRERGSNTKSAMIVMAGQIDSNYTGEWFIAIYNGNDIPIEITKNVSDVVRSEDFIRVPYQKAIAQFAVEIVPDIVLTEIKTDEMDAITTNRGNGYLGSSGK